MQDTTVRTQNYRMQELCNGIHTQRQLLATDSPNLHVPELAACKICSANLKMMSSNFYSTHLGGCCDGSISSQVQTPLSKPHHGLVAPVFGLSDVLIYLLQQPAAIIQMGEKKRSKEWKGKIRG